MGRRPDAISYVEVGKTFIDLHQEQHTERRYVNHWHLCPHMDGGPNRHISFVTMNGKPWDGSAEEMAALRELAASIEPALGIPSPLYGDLLAAYRRYQIAKAKYEGAQIHDYTPYFRSKEQ